MIQYQHAIWTHDFHDEPVSLWSELDDHGMEIRKVEVFRDGRRRRAPPSARDTGTHLGEFPVPPIDEINRDQQFRARLVDGAAFEIEWSASESTNSLENHPPRRPWPTARGIRTPEDPE